MDTRTSNLSALELAQRCTVLETPLPRKRLSGWDVALLAFLRVYVVFSVGLVVLAFVGALR